MVLCVADRRRFTMRDYMKALCCRFETTSRRAEYLDRKIERTYRQLTRLLDEPERKLLLKIPPAFDLPVQSALKVPMSPACPEFL